MSLLLKGGLSKGICLKQSLRLSTEFRHSSTNSQTQKNEASSNDSSDWFNQEIEGDIDERIVPKPKSIMPDHLPQVRRRQVQKPWWKFRYFIDLKTVPKDRNEYTETPEYPEIHDPSTKGIKKAIRSEWYKAIRRLPTADEKIYEITKHYGHISYCVEPVFRQYNMLPTQQAITNTRLVDGLPDKYNQNSGPVPAELKEAIIKTIQNRLSTKGRNESYDNKRFASSNLGIRDKENAIQTAMEEDILSDVVKLVRNFSSNSPVVHTDYLPYVGTSWWMNDYPIPFKKARWFQDREKIDQCFVYRATHPLHLRASMPLPPIVELNDELCTNLTTVNNESIIPEKYNLRLGVPLRRHNILSLPGFWPGQSDGFDFPVLIGLTREHLRWRIARNQRDFNDSDDVLKGMAIMSAFSTLTGAANNLGFSLYDSLTYPLVCHVINTDGINWSFNVYQLNKFNFHSDLVATEPQACNICWSSGDQKLFNMNDNGDITDVNDTVFNNILKFINVSTIEAPAFELRPYLGPDQRSPDEKAEMNYALRRKFTNRISTFIARRKKTNLWETIYKNHHEAPMDQKRIRPKLQYEYPPFFT